ncbi:MAG: DUF5989 family protein [Planctomycetota bacterium]
MSSFGRFLAENKLWWILPLVIVLALVGWMLFTEPTPGEAAGETHFQYPAY